MMGRIDEDKMLESADPIQPLRLPPLRFRVYIDGYNFYGAINHSDPTWLFRLGWCNYQRLGEHLVGEAFQTLGKPEVTVIYFTTKVDEKKTAHRGESRRQKLWLDALHDEAPDLKYRYGQFVRRTEVWKRNPVGTYPEKLVREISREKKTDVNIALEMFKDVAAVRPAGMVLISGDQDLQPAVEYVARARIPIAVFNPHGHGMYQLSPDADSAFFRIGHLSRPMVEQCRLKSNDSWLAYLKSKSDDFPEFRPCLEYELSIGKLGRM